MTYAEERWKEKRGIVRLHLEDTLTGLTAHFKSCSTAQTLSPAAGLNPAAVLSLTLNFSPEAPDQPFLYSHGLFSFTGFSPSPSFILSLSPTLDRCEETRPCGSLQSAWLNLCFYFPLSVPKTHFSIDPCHYRSSRTEMDREVLLFVHELRKMRCSSFFRFVCRALFFFFPAAIQYHIQEDVFLFFSFKTWSKSTLRIRFVDPGMSLNLFLFYRGVFKTL